MKDSDLSRWQVRDEAPGDAGDIAAVTTAAFGQPAEAALVAALRAAVHYHAAFGRFAE